MRVPASVSSRALLFLVFILLGSAHVPDEARGQATGEAGLSVIMGSPQGEFGSQVDAVGIGINGFAGMRPSPRSVFLLGVDMGILIYGHERRSEPFSYSIPDVFVDVITDNNILLGHFLLRIQPPRGPVRPYLDGLFGMKYLFTTTRIQDRGYYDDDPIAISTNFDDAALSYGVGGGVSMQLFRSGSSRHRGVVSLDIGMRYLIGGEALYLQRGSIRRSHGDATYDVYRSETNLLETHVGASIRF